MFGAGGLLLAGRAEAMEVALEPGVEQKEIASEEATTPPVV